MTTTRSSFGFDRFSRTQKPLSLDTIQRMAPAIFADAPAETVSERYKFIETRRVFEAIIDSGYQVVHVQTARSKAASDKAKHLVVFQPTDSLISLRNVGDTVAQLRLINGHDGKTGYQMSAGAFRLICLNGLVVSDGERGSVRVRHSGKDVIDRVIEGLFEISRYLPVALEMKNEMEHIPLNQEAERVMAMGAIALRWGRPNRGDLHLPDGTTIVLPQDMPEEVDGEVIDVTNSMEDDEPQANRGPLRAPVTIDQMVYARRDADRVQPGQQNINLWVGLNKIQENLINPNFRGEHINDVTNSTTYRKVSRVTNVSQDQRINMGLWVLANEMQKALSKAVI